MTLLPSRHVRDPRRRYRANQIRKRVREAVPPPVAFVVPPELVQGLVALPVRDRTTALQRIERERGSVYVEFVIRALAEALREKRQQ